MNNNPNPGTEQAIKQDCICPVLDNHYGKGAYNDGKAFWYTEGCPIHAIKLKDKEMKKPQDTSPRLTREANLILDKWKARYKTPNKSEAIMRVEYELTRNREGFIY